MIFKRPKNPIREMDMLQAKPEGEPPLRPNFPNVPVLSPLVRLFDFSGAIVVLVMAVIVNVDVFGRFLFNAPLVGTFELSEMGIVAIVFLQLAGTIAARQMTRSETLLALVERRNEVIGHIMRAIFNLLGMSIMLIIIIGQYPRLIDAYVRGYFKGNVGIFTAPMWPLETVMLSGATLAAIMFLVLAIQNIRAITNRNKRGAQ